MPGRVLGRADEIKPQPIGARPIRVYPRGTLYWSLRHHLFDERDDVIAFELRGEVGGDVLVTDGLEELSSSLDA